MMTIPQPNNPQAVGQTRLYYVLSYNQYFVDGIVNEVVTVCVISKQRHNGADCLPIRRSVVAAGKSPVEGYVYPERVRSALIDDIQEFIGNIEDPPADTVLANFSQLFHHLDAALHYSRTNGQYLAKLGSQRFGNDNLLLPLLSDAESDEQVNLSCDFTDRSTAFPSCATGLLYTQPQADLPLYANYCITRERMEQLLSMWLPDP